MRRILLTGATGFLGGELAVALSRLNAVEQLACLVRAGDLDEATARLRKVFALHGDIYDDRKVIAIAGDLTDSQLAPNLMQQAELAGVDTVVHAAASTSFLAQKRNAIQETNVFGTMKIVNWAQSLETLQTFAYIGTATIVGAGPEVTGRTILEDESPNGSSTHLVDYTRSKMLAEMMVRSAIPPEKLVVLRPSILLGDSRAVVPRSFDIAWIIIAIKHLRMFFSNPQAACDIIPVDYATNAIIRLLKNERCHTTYHISAGDLSTTCRLMADSIDYSDAGKPPLVFCSGRELALIKKWLRSLETPDPALQPYSEHLEYIRYQVGVKETRLLLSGLDAYWHFIDLDQRFHNARMLADSRIVPPAPAHEYVKGTAAYLQDLNPIHAACNP